MIKQEAAVKTALATDVLLALEELQKVVDSKQNVRLPGVNCTAIIWLDGKLHYKAYLDADKMIWTDGLFIGAISRLKVTWHDRIVPRLDQSRLKVTWHDRIVPRLDQECLDKISQAWFSALTGLASNVVSTDLAIGRIPAHYGIDGVEINPGRFVFEFAYLSEVNADEAYVDLMEAQLETLLAPLSDPDLSLEQARDLCDELWTDNNLLEMDLISAIDWFSGKRDISASLRTARAHLDKVC